MPPRGECQAVPPCREGRAPRRAPPPCPTCARAAREGVPASFAVADMEELDLGRRDFDAVLLFDALHHCPGNAGVLRRAWEHLRPGGHLLLLEPSWLHRYSPHARAFSRQHG